MEGKSAAAPSYVEFEPFCQWQREEGRDVLVIQLPEFRKEQLRVQINSRGILKISGERQDSGKISKFYKEVEVPKYCETNGIQAKFANGSLYVIMPKIPNKSSTEQTNSKAADDQKKNSEATEATEAPAAEEKKSAAEPAQDAGIRKKETERFPNPKTVGSTVSKDVITTSKGSISKMKICAKTSLNVAVAVAVLAALGSYFFYMYRSVVLHD